MKGNTLISILVVVFVALLGFGVLYFILAPKDVNVIVETTPTPTIEDTTPTVTNSIPPITAAIATTTPLVDITPPADWKLIDNMDFLPYIVYRPAGWYYRYFSPSTLGLDTNPLPVNSEYTGIISITLLQNSTQWNDDYISQLEPQYTQKTQLIDNNTWTIIEGKFKENEIFGSQFVKLAYLKNGSKEYVVKIASSNENYNGHESKFDILVSILEFK